jgi:hypothetical protein
MRLKAPNRFWCQTVDSLLEPMTVDLLLANPIEGVCERHRFAMGIVPFANTVDMGEKRTYEAVHADDCIAPKGVVSVQRALFERKMRDVALGAIHGRNLGQQSNVGVQIAQLG